MFDITKIFIENVGYCLDRVFDLQGNLLRKKTEHLYQAQKYVSQIQIFKKSAYKRPLRTNSSRYCLAEEQNDRLTEVKYMLIFNI